MKALKKIAAKKERSVEVKIGYRCSCQIKIMGQEYVPPLIVRQCPLCSAAPELLAEGAAALRVFESIPRSIREKMNFTDWDLILRLSAAIAKAYGR